MPDRMRPEDAAFLAAETPRAPRQVAVVMILDPGERGFDHQGLLELIDDRIGLVPRYRQRVQAVLGGLASPAWVDDEAFDLSYHVRRSAVPRPGTMTQLQELVSRLVARPLDRQRPLWEVYLIEGLEDGNVAMVLKAHQALVDGIDTVALGQILMDSSPERRELPVVDWRPEPAPSQLWLVGESVADTALHPDRLLGPVAAGLRLVGQSLRLPGAPRGRPDSPLSTDLCRQRRFVGVDTRLDVHRRIRETHGGTVNDVVLTVVTGALRAWLLTRAEPVGPATRIRAMVPLSVRDDQAEPTSLGSHVAGHLLTLPVGEANPVVRLHHVSYALKAHRETGRAISADRLVATPGLASTTFHVLGSRVADSQASLPYQLVVTNVPGPQEPMYAHGARLLATYPVLPLTEPRALAIGASSYDGGVFYGINADRDAVPDADVLAQCLTEALDELAETARPERPRAPRGRTGTAKKARAKQPTRRASPRPRKRSGGP